LRLRTCMRMAGLAWPGHGRRPPVNSHAQTQLLWPMQPQTTASMCHLVSVQTEYLPSLHMRVKGHPRSRGREQSGARLRTALTVRCFVIAAVALAMYDGVLAQRTTAGARVVVWHHGCVNLVGGLELHCISCTRGRRPDRTVFFFKKKCSVRLHKRMKQN
jgi:hypothetical protein